MTFGEFYKSHRLKSRLTLREYCREYGYDPGSISKLERGRTKAPQNPHILNGHIKALKLSDTDAEQFRSLAAISAGIIPHKLTDSELATKLPVLFQIANDATKEDLKRFAEFLRDRL